MPGSPASFQSLSQRTARLPSAGTPVASTQARFKYNCALLCKTVQGHSTDLPGSRVRTHTKYTQVLPSSQSLTNGKKHLHLFHEGKAFALRQGEPLRRAVQAAGQGPALQGDAAWAAGPWSLVSARWFLSHRPALVPGPLLVRPVRARVWLCGLRVEPCGPGSPRLLVSMAFGTCHGSGWAESRWGQPQASRPMNYGAASREGPWPLRLQGPRCDNTAPRVEVTGLSHGFLMVQIEVSLLPLCVGRSHQAGGGSARTASPNSGDRGCPGALGSARSCGHSYPERRQEKGQVEPAP